jgi:lysozyme
MAAIRAEWCPGIIDLSDNQDQNSIDWNAVVAAGIVAVIHKATEGETHKDPFFDTRKKEAKKAGLLWGSYHYGRGGVAADGARQADYFLKVARPLPDELICFDCEADSTLDVMETFVRRVKDQTDRYPAIYGRHKLKAVLNGHLDSVVFKCHLWFNDFPADSPIPKQDIPKGWRDWTLWQYWDGTSGPTPHGLAAIPGRVDRSVFKGSATALKAAWPFSAD